MSKKLQTLVSRFQSNPRPAEKSIPSSTWGNVWTLSKSFNFQYKVLNSILFTNKKLCGKIGYIQDDKCSLCKTDSESLYRIFFTLTREFVCLTLQDVITGILYTNCPLLNYLIYLILIAKLYLWDCRSNQTLPVITAFSSKVKRKVWNRKVYMC